MASDPDHWALKAGNISPPEVLAVSPDGTSQIVTQSAWYPPSYFRNILVLNGEPVPETHFDTRSGRASVKGFDERTQTWYGTCLDGYGTRCRWFISVPDRTLRFEVVEEDDR